MFRKLRKITLIVMICLILFMSQFSDVYDKESRYCFNCLDDSNLASCTKVTVCGQHEECYIKKTLAEDGIVYYSQGCIDKQMCQSSSGKRSDITVCQECCNTDFCNYKGCNEQGVRPDVYNRLCLDCGGSKFDTPNKCHKVSACGTGKKCSVTMSTDLNGSPIYQLGCKREQDCSSAESPCNKCCTGPFCNYECSSNGNQDSTLSWLKFPTTTVNNNWNIITKPLTTPLPIWQIIPGRFINYTACFSCKGISSTSDCSEFTHCGQHEQCFVEAAVSPGGITLLSSGCTPKYTCHPNSFRDTSNTVTCQHCCDTDFCNMNGCGQKVGSSDISHLCVTCQGAIRPEDCKTVSRCKADELCMIQPSLDLNGKQTVNMGCARKDYCSNMDTKHCTGCCHGAYCNKDCYTFNRKTLQHHMTSHVTVPTSISTTRTTTVPTTTTQKTTTTAALGVICYHCEFISSSYSCHKTSHCRTGEVCQIKELTGSNGMRAYRLRCVDQQTCWRKGQNSRVGCCNTNRCNNNPDILTN